MHDGKHARWALMSDTSLPPGGRRKFLAVVDSTPECRVALRFAARRAQHTGGIVTLLYVVPPADFQQWAGVERVMREEAYQEAERALFEAAKTVNEIVGAMPELVTREGREGHKPLARIDDLPLFAEALRAAKPSAPQSSALEDALRAADPDALTPKGALEFIYALKRLLPERER